MSGKVCKERLAVILRHDQHTKIRIQQRKQFVPRAMMGI